MEERSNPPKGLKKSKGDVASEPSVAATTRVKEFPGERLSVVCGKLFCNACREESLCLSRRV